MPVELVLTIVNVIAIIALVVITWQYTKATKSIFKATDKMVELETERKVWEVQPILVPYYEIVKGTGLGKKQPLKNFAGYPAGPCRSRYSIEVARECPH